MLHVMLDLRRKRTDSDNETDRLNKREAALLTKFEQCVLLHRTFLHGILVVLCYVVVYHNTAYHIRVHYIISY